MSPTPGLVAAMRELAALLDNVSALQLELNPRAVASEDEAELQAYAAALRRAQAATDQLLRHVRWVREGRA